MTKKRNNKNKKEASYKPSLFKNDSATSKEVSQKRQKVTAEDAEFKTELKVTPDMFEAARRMKGGVTHIKELDMSVVKRRNTLKREPGTCDFTLIDIFTGEVKTV